MRNKERTTENRRHESSKGTYILCFESFWEYTPTPPFVGELSKMKPSFEKKNRLQVSLCSVFYVFGRIVIVNNLISHCSRTSSNLSTYSPSYHRESEWGRDSPFDWLSMSLMHLSTFTGKCKSRFSLNCYFTNNLCGFLCTEQERIKDKIKARVSRKAEKYLLGGGKPMQKMDRKCVWLTQWDLK